MLGHVPPQPLPPPHLPVQFGTQQVFVDVLHTWPAGQEFGQGLPQGSTPPHLPAQWLAVQVMQMVPPQNCPAGHVRQEPPQPLGTSWQKPPQLGVQVPGTQTVSAQRWPVGQVLGQVPPQPFGPPHLPVQFGVQHWLLLVLQTWGAAQVLGQVPPQPLSPPHLPVHWGRQH